MITRPDGATRNDSFSAGSFLCGSDAWQNPKAANGVVIVGRANRGEALRGFQAGVS